MSAEISYTFSPEEYDDHCRGREEPESWEWLHRLRQDVSQQRRKPPHPRLRLVPGTLGQNTPGRISNSQLHTIDGSASVLFHFGARLIGHALIRNAVDKTIAQSDINKTIELLRKSA